MSTKFPRFALLLLCAALAACSRSGGESEFLKQHIGEECVVQFRRDALGAAAANPVPPKTDTMNGAEVIQFGKLVAVEGKGLVIENPGAQPVRYWIPYPVILSLKFTGTKMQ